MIYMVFAANNQDVLEKHMKELTPKYIEVSAAVRYWKDTDVNGVPDADGKLIPFRVGENWCPVIRLDDGQVMDWPNVRADVHYKVCDAGKYWLLDERRKRIAEWGVSYFKNLGGFYVPNNFLCVESNGYGDYIIMTINSDGKIQGWKKPEIVYETQEDRDSEVFSGPKWVEITDTREQEHRIAAALKLLSGVPIEDFEGVSLDDFLRNRLKGGAH